MTAPLDYRSAGVDIDAADDSKHRIRAHVESTFTAGARGAFGGFGGMFRVPPEFKEPLLVSSADGVGTKIKVAIEAGRNDTVGHCLVNHCVNDILVQGAVPLFFLDYVAFGKLVPSVVEAIVKGVAAGCRENGCALIGGETAEMPGMYAEGDYDLAGFCVGAVERDAVLTGQTIAAGDVILGLASSGVHSNGFSLVRRLAADRGWKLDRPALFDADRLLIDTLMAPTRIYVASLLPLLRERRIKGLAHITGGGLLENIPRVLPEGTHAVVDADAQGKGEFLLKEEGVGQLQGYLFGRPEMARPWATPKPVNA